MQLINSLNIIQPRNSFYFSLKKRKNPKYAQILVNVTPVDATHEMGQFCSLCSNVRCVRAIAIIDFLWRKKKKRWKFPTLAYLFAVDSTSTCINKTCLHGQLYTCAAAAAALRRDLCENNIITKHKSLRLGAKQIDMSKTEIEDRRVASRVKN